MIVTTILSKIHPKVIYSQSKALNNSLEYYSIYIHKKDLQNHLHDNSYRKQSGITVNLLDKNLKKITYKFAQVPGTSCTPARKARRPEPDSRGRLPPPPGDRNLWEQGDRAVWGTGQVGWATGPRRCPWEPRDPGDRSGVPRLRPLSPRGHARREGRGRLQRLLVELGFFRRETCIPWYKNDFVIHSYKMGFSLWNNIQEEVFCISYYNMHNHRSNTLHWTWVPRPKANIVFARI